MALTTVPVSLSATALTLTTAAQPNITSVGTLTGLTVSGNIAGTLTTAAQPNITSVGTLSALTISGDLTIADKIIHSGDTDTFFRFAGANDIRIVAGNVEHAAFDVNTIVFNQSGANMDFRVESTGSASMLHVDAGNNRVGIGTNSPNAILSLGSSTGKKLLVYDGSTANNLYAGFAIDMPAANDFSMFAHNTGSLKFGKMGTDASTITTHMTIDNSGNVSVTGTGTFAGGSTNNNDDANILTLNASQHARLLVDTSSTGGHRATLALESNGNELTLATTGSASYLASVGALGIDGGKVDINKATSFSAYPVGSQLNVYANGEGIRLDGTGATSRNIRFRNVSDANPGVIIADGSLKLETEDANTDIRLSAIRDIEYQVTSGNSTAGFHYFKSYNTTIMAIDGGNNRVGIGTDSPTANLTITDENAGQATIQARNYATSATGSFGNNHAFEFRSATSTTTHGMLVAHYENNASRRSLEVADSTGIFATFVQGKLGIGNDQPATALHIKGDIGQEPENTFAVSGGGSTSYIDLYDVHGSYIRGSGRLRAMGTENNLNVGYVEYFYAYSRHSNGTYYINIKLIDEAYVNNTYARPRFYLTNASGYNTGTNRQTTNQTANSTSTNILRVSMSNVANAYGTFQFAVEPFQWHQ